MYKSGNYVLIGRDYSGYDTEYQVYLDEKMAKMVYALMFANKLPMLAEINRIEE